LEEQLFLLRPPSEEATNRRGIRVLADTSRIIDGERQLIGHLANYDEVLPDGAQIFELPVTRAWGNNLELVSHLARQHRVIQIRGGKHVGQSIAPLGLLDNSSAHIDGDYDDRADQIDLKLIQTALDHPEIFLDATCRGFQLVLAHLLGLLPEEVPNHRSAPGDPATIHQITNVVKKLYGPHAPVALRTLHQFDVNSYHMQGFRLEMIEPHLDVLKENGFYVTHVSQEDEVVEMLFRLNKRGEVSGLLKQFHPEKMKGNPVGDLFIAWQKEAIRRAVL
ncbi:MAG TPA: gamma-glutamyl-gamma-aminobutyrate hydrolase family protein, partial [Candidatus Woesebacteria bacterium]|nr:gamma-glutamyl-gamma-aminobutyrate hydrolase family protein [Candidatus Woesebacteria bacterium]